MSREPSGALLALMAVVWPGAGQFIQKRWLVGAIYAAGFLVSAAFTFVYGTRIIVAWYGLLEHDTTEAELSGIQACVRKMFLFFVVTILVWILSVVDLGLSHVQRRRKEILARFDKQNLPSDR